MLADSLTDLWASRLMTYELRAGIDAGVDVKVQHAQCSMAKLFASEAAGRVADRAVQIFGGRGYMRENVAERFYRELRVDRIWEGDLRDPAEHHRRPAGEARRREPDRRLAIGLRRRGSPVRLG